MAGEKSMTKKEKPVKLRRLVSRRLQGRAGSITGKIQQQVLRHEWKGRSRVRTAAELKGRIEGSLASQVPSCSKD